MPFTPEEVNIAVKVLAKSKIVDEWVRGMAKSFGVDLKSPEGKDFYRRERINAARRLLK